MGPYRPVLIPSIMTICYRFEDSTLPREPGRARQSPEPHGRRASGLLLGQVGLDKFLERILYETRKIVAREVASLVAII
jgi:hypothetical protein